MAYGLHVTATAPMQGGYLHRTWRADTTQGPLFVKLYSGTGWPLEKVAFTLQVQQALAEGGEPVPAVVRAQSGEVAVPVGPDGVLAVMRFAAGRHLAPDELVEGPARSVGETLGRIHADLRTWPADGAPLIPDTTQVLEHARQLLDAARKRSAPDEADRLAEEAAAYRIRSLQRRPIDPADYELAVFQVVHGDYYPGNLLFDEQGRVSAVVDFDFCGPRWRGLEVSRALVETGLQPDGRFRAVPAAAFLAGYLAQNDLPAGERRTMFRIWYDYLLHSTYPLPLRYWGGQPMPHGWERLARRRHSLLLWLGEHMGELERLAS